MRAARSPPRYPTGAGAEPHSGHARRAHAEGTETLGADLDRLDDEVTRYGRALEMAVAARAAGCFVPSMLVEGGDIARGAGRLAERAVRQGESREHDRARALRKVAGHLHALDLALDDRGLGHGALDVVARALAAALDVFAGPDIHGLARLQDRVDLLLDHLEHHPGLLGMAQHLLGIGTAAEFSWENHPPLRRRPARSAIR